ncbi:MFS transporter [Frankia canadensis]|uniref:MFS transporter n=1 Tax=Frankia canadensis TaxID=1836972 RepID=UPI000C79B4DA|nr:MFS transporter [Frankia canadensis]
MASAGAPRAAVARLLVALTAATLLQWCGSFAIAPLLPLYLRDRHVSAAAVGVVMAAFFLGALLSQYLAGRAAARHGPRPVLLAGLAGYAAGCLGLVAVGGVAATAAMRVLQGAGAGAFEVATLTAVAATVAPGMRGRAFSAVFTGQLLGLTVGPLLGGLAGERHMDAMFLTSGAAAVLASLPVVWLLPARSPSHPSPAVTQLDALTRVDRPAFGRRHARGLAGLLLIAACGGFATGVYETCWSLLMRREGESTAFIGVTFALFGLPYLVFAWPAGWLVDRLDRRRLLMVTITLRGAAVAAYPFLHSRPLILVIGCLEGIVLAVIYPASQALLAQESARTGSVGRGQGVFATTQTAWTVLAALLSGALFAADPRLPFVLAAAALLATVATLPTLFRQVAGVALGGSAVPAGRTAGGPAPAPGRWARARRRHSPDRESVI